MSAEATFLVGIDAGGTRTRAVLADGAGGLRARAAAGPGDYQRLGPRGVVERVRELYDQLGLDAQTARSVCLCAGVAGAGRPDDQARLMRAFQSAGLGSRIRVVSDARAALEGAHGGGPGIVAISGTGSIVIGRNGLGQEARAGGWGPALGDEGSAYGLVMSGVRAVLRAADGWAPATALSEVLRADLGLGTWDEIVGAVYGGRLDRERLAAACPALFEAVAAGDEVAAGIVVEGAVCLGRQVAAVAARLGLSAGVDVACAGGVFAHGQVLWPHLAAAASAAGVVLRQKVARLAPVFGALLLAAQGAGATLPPDAVDRWPAAADPP